MQVVIIYNLKKLFNIIISKSLNKILDIECYIFNEKTKKVNRINIFIYYVYIHLELDAVQDLNSKKLPQRGHLAISSSLSCIKGN